MLTTDELRRVLGPVGIWMPPPAGTGLDQAAYAREIEAAGFTSVWFPRMNSPEDLAAVEPALAATKRLVLGTGIASVWTWTPADLAAETNRLAAAYPDRFILGLGVSHAPAVEASGQAYLKPYSKMVQFLGELGAVSAPVVLAALGPKMLELSRDAALGAHPYFTPPEHTRFSREALGPQPLLIPELAAALDPGEGGAAAARAYAKRYLRLPNYTNNLKRFGFTDADIEGAGSDRLMNSVVPNGPLALSARLAEHLAAGADHVLVQLVTEGGAFDAGGLHELTELVADSAELGSKGVCASG
ncbi:MAG TPA: TIGR03620 family F420-dependent LLM class oxidoreductase [Trebonia sp.]|nr:TIGR03620 family F420-dependent LLM class oxidoreductase [Trebonia sp.]